MKKLIIQYAAILILSCLIGWLSVWSRIIEQIFNRGFAPLLVLFLIIFTFGLDFITKKTKEPTKTIIKVFNLGITIGIAIGAVVFGFTYFNK